MRTEAKRRKRGLREPWFGGLLPVICEVGLAFAVVTTTLLALEIGRSAEAVAPVHGPHYSPTGSAPLA